MSFSADWLALRAPADGRARSARLMAKAGAAARARAGAEAARILDLGAGTGATARALAPFVPGPQAWTLVDADAGLLAAAEAGFREAPPAPQAVVSILAADLRADPAPWEAPPHLVTASALFDLASRAFVEALADRLAGDGVPLLAMLTYDGRLSVEPPHAADAAMAEAFNTHQRGEKSFGPALGPDGARVLAEALAARGFSVETEDAPWRLERPRDEALMHEKLTGWAAAARELGQLADVDGWLSDRLARAGRITVGHTDLLALPPGSG